VEFSSELYDFISEDLSRLYPQLMDYTRMTVYDVGSSILNSFDSKLSDYATKKFNRRGIQIKTGTHVERVEKDYLDIKEEGKGNILNEGKREPSILTDLCPSPLRYAGMVYWAYAKPSRGVSSTHGQRPKKS
jgi:NADH dehydrogenase FAD-containing subunit